MLRDSLLSLTASIVFFTACSATAWIYLGPDSLEQASVQHIYKKSPQLPDADIHRTFKIAIAERLAELGVEPHHLGTQKRLNLQTEAGLWPVDHMQVFLEPEMAAKRLFHLLEHTNLPGAQWHLSAQDDFTFYAEASLEQMPSLVLHLIPPVQAPKPSLMLAPPEFSLLLTGLGPNFETGRVLLEPGDGISLAVKAQSAYALEWAEGGQIGGKEIWLDLQASSGADTPWLRKQLGSVPYLRGVWLPSWPRQSQDNDQWLPAQLFELLNKHNLALASTGQNITEEAMLLAPAGGLVYDLQAPARHLERQLERLLALAARDGAAVGMIPPGNWHPEGLRNWIKSAKRRGYAPVSTTSALHERRQN